MTFPGYDAWKTRSPDDERPECEFCGTWRMSMRHGWQPEECTGECGIKWRDPDYEREAKQER